MSNQQRDSVDSFVYVLREVKIPMSDMCTVCKSSACSVRFCDIQERASWNLQMAKFFPEGLYIDMTNASMVCNLAMATSQLLLDLLSDRNIRRGKDQSSSSGLHSSFASVW